MWWWWRRWGGPTRQAVEPWSAAVTRSALEGVLAVGDAARRR